MAQVWYRYSSHILYTVHCICPMCQGSCVRVNGVPKPQLHSGGEGEYLKAGVVFV